MLKFDTYKLPAFWAPVLINDEFSGLTSAEENNLNNWLKFHNPGICVSVSENQFFTYYHDADGLVLPCDCLIFTFQRV